jgi:hypothetical protein
VLYDNAKDNSFRALIPMTQHFPVLLQIMVANSALRMANAYHSSLTQDLTQDSTSASSLIHLKFYRDALTAKQYAFQMLRGTLENINKANIDAMLAVVLLFTEYELIDSGRDSWKHHINGAKAIIQKLCKLDSSIPLSKLRSFLISNLLV